MAFMEDSFSSYGTKKNLLKHLNYLPLILLQQKLNTFTDYGSMQCFLNTFCKEFYTCTCKMKDYKEIVFVGVKIWYSETLTKH